MRFPILASAAMTVVSVAVSGQSPAPGHPTPATGTTFEKFEARRAGRLLAADTDGDGRVGRAEFLDAARAGGGDPAKRFARLDTNGDGFVDRAEIDATLRRRFARKDADGDGVLSPAERTAGRGGRRGDVAGAG